MRLAAGNGQLLHGCRDILADKFKLGRLKVWIETRAGDVASVKALARLHEAAKRKQQVGHVEPKVELNAVRDEQAKIAVFPSVENRE